jgi:hypothetical protein
LGKDPAPVDIPHQQTGRLRVMSNCQVGNILRPEVDFGSAACAFDDDQIVLLP